MKLSTTEKWIFDQMSTYTNLLVFACKIGLQKFLPSVDRIMHVMQQLIWRKKLLLVLVVLYRCKEKIILSIGPKKSINGTKSCLWQGRSPWNRYRTHIHNAELLSLGAHAWRNPSLRRKGHGIKLTNMKTCAPDRQRFYENLRSREKCSKLSSSM